MGGETLQIPAFLFFFNSLDMDMTLNSKTHKRIMCLLLCVF